MTVNRIQYSVLIQYSSSSLSWRYDGDPVQVVSELLISRQSSYLLHYRDKDWEIPPTLVSSSRQNLTEG